MLAPGQCLLPPPVVRTIALREEITRVQATLRHRATPLSFLGHAMPAPERASLVGRGRPSRAVLSVLRKRSLLQPACSRCASAPVAAGGAYQDQVISCEGDESDAEQQARSRRRTSLDDGGIVRTARPPGRAVSDLVGALSNIASGHTSPVSAHGDDQIEDNPPFNESDCLSRPELRSPVLTLAREQSF